MYINVQTPYTNTITEKTSSTCHSQIFGFTTIFVIQRNYLQELLHHINSLHPQTPFTKEEEEDSILPFLNTLVQRNPDKTISVKAYRKPTHTNQYLNYTSHHSTSAKQECHHCLI